MTHHHLKTWPEHFSPIVSGEKTFELRREDDKKFEVGDKLTLNEYTMRHPAEGFADGIYTGRSVLVRVTHVLRGPSQWGLTEGSVILSIRLAT